MAIQYCNYDIKGTLGVVGTATIGGALNVTEYIYSHFKKEFRIYTNLFKSDLL